MEIPLIHIFKKHTHRLFLSDSTEQADNVGVVEFGHEGSFLLKFCPLLGVVIVFQSLYSNQLSMVHAWEIEMALIDLSKGTFTQFFHKTHSREWQLLSLALYERKEKCGLKHF